MNCELVQRLASAVLYEGYILYPYRPSVKNRQRWTFGGLYPEAFCGAFGSGESSNFVTECLVRGCPDSDFEATVRFLHLTSRAVGACESNEGEPRYQPVESMKVGDRIYHSWQEAEEREVAIGPAKIESLLSQPLRQSFSFPGRHWIEPVLREDEATEVVLTRQQQAIEGEIAIVALPVADDLFRLSLTVANRTPLENPEGTTRDDALARCLVSAHAILAIRGGEFISLTDPPDDCRDAAAKCRNRGVWPVLVGDGGDRDAVLASPLILPDYPTIAPESPGDLFDGTEIDEILTMRVLTLTDEEKQQAHALDERARALLDRTEGLTAEQLSRLHGTLRHVRPVAGEVSHG